MIFCGHCRQHHETVAEVRDCSVVSPSSEVEELGRQLSELLQPHRAVMAAQTRQKDLDVWIGPVEEGFYRVPVQVKLEAVAWYNQSGDPARCAECKIELPLDYMVYFEFGHHMGGESRCKEHEYSELIRTEYSYVKVQLNQSGTGRYAKRLHTVQEVVDGKVEITSATWEYEPGLIRQIRPSHVLTEEQAAEFGKLYGWCCICGRRLTNEQSIERGIGPICAGNQGW